MTPANPFSLEGQAAVVTGAAMGIGFAIAQRMLDAGADVLLADLDHAALDAAVAKLAGGGGKVEALAVDVAAPDAGGAMVAKAVEAFGRLDIFVNNAGIYPLMPAMEMRPEFFDRVVDVNVKGLVFASQAAAARMVAQGQGGAIVNIASIDALRPSAVGLAAYDTSKGAVLMFTKNLALELAPHGIRVNAIAPGWIGTEGTLHAPPGMTVEELVAQRDEQAKAAIPLGRVGRPDEIAYLAVFLASSAASYMTGELVVCDGGIMLR